jgi:hypothetical protein
MHRTAEQTAILLALLFKRASLKRARISERTIRVLSKRRSLRAVFLEGLRGALDDFGIHMIELERGGFGLIPVSALDGAQAILAKNYISDDLKTLRQQEKLSRQEKVFTNFKEEVTGDEETEGDEE